MEAGQRLQPLTPAMAEAGCDAGPVRLSHGRPGILNTRYPLVRPHRRGRALRRVLHRPVRRWVALAVIVTSAAVALGSVLGTVLGP